MQGLAPPGRASYRRTEEALLTLKLLVDPVAQGAYFADLPTVCRAELHAVMGPVEMAMDPRATLAFVDVALDASHAPALARLSFVQGVFRGRGEALELLDVDPGYRLPAELVSGAKYRGKTHEHVTQLALNLALAACAVPHPSTVLDPMAGRGTTLFWALRYGLEAWGIEQDPQALDHVHRHIKRQAKLHRLKHTLQRGGKKSGASLDLRFPTEEGLRLRLLTGDSRRAPELLQKKRFDMLVSDLPYGVQFVGPKGTRNPRDLLTACAPAWADSLHPGGSMVMIYNRLQPTRKQLAAPFTAAGLLVQEAEAPHRMSESILRDILVLTKP